MDRGLYVEAQGATIAATRKEADLMPGLGGHAVTSREGSK